MHGHLVTTLSEIAAGVCLILGISGAVFLLVYIASRRSGSAGNRAVLRLGSFEMSLSSAIGSICALSAVAIALYGINRLDMADKALEAANPVAPMASATNKLPRLEPLGPR